MTDFPYPPFSELRPRLLPAGGTGHRRAARSRVAWRIRAHGATAREAPASPLRRRDSTERGLCCELSQRRSVDVRPPALHT
jgi:hypothetical protein